MDHNERDVFANLWYSFCRHYNNPRAASEIATYWALLEGYAFSDVVYALQRHVNVSGKQRFFPRPIDIIGHILEYRADMAWDKVQCAIARQGCYGKVTFDDPLITPIIQVLGGWVWVCQTPRLVLHRVKAAFVKEYIASYTHQTPFIPEPYSRLGKSHLTCDGMVQRGSLLFSENRRFKKDD